MHWCTGPLVYWWHIVAHKNQVAVDASEYRIQHVSLESIENVLVYTFYWMQNLLHFIVYEKFSNGVPLYFTFANYEHS